MIAGTRRVEGSMADFDLAVIGAGASGAAIARDAAGRGIKVLLLDQNDLSSGASFGPDMLVRNALEARRGSLGAWRAALAEREAMLATAPHLARAQRIVLLPQESDRSALELRGRLFACDHLATRRILPATQTLDLTHHAFGTALRRQFDFGFAYSDCRVDEVRLPVANARDAADRGAVVRTRTCLHAERGEDWTLVLNARGDAKASLRACSSMRPVRWCSKSP
jgi:glycerol-3-phosphate dehydrogenase